MKRFFVLWCLVIIPEFGEYVYEMTEFSFRVSSRIRSTVYRNIAVDQIVRNYDLVVQLIYFYCFHVSLVCV